MIGQVITFDGHRLNDLFYVGEATVGLPSVEHEVADMRRGATWRSRRVTTCEVSVTLVAKPVRGQRPRAAVSTLLSWLDADGPRWLTLSSDDGLRRLVVPTGAPTGEGDEDVTVTFLQLDPYLYGEARSARIPSGGTSVTFDVGGDAPTMPTIACGYVTALHSENYVWQLEHAADGTRTGVQIADPDAYADTTKRAAVSIDCTSRAVTVNNATAMLTLSSDWLELTPGVHTLREVNGGHISGSEVTISWTERWHR